MTVLPNIFVGIVALLHLYFLVLEMFLWDKPKGLKTFGMSREQATATKTLAVNQGLYNGFLSAGLIWGMLLEKEGTPVIIFFLCCIMLAGIVGALTASRKILFVQFIPAAIALVFVVFV